MSAAGPPVLFGVRLWASVCLALYVTFWLQLDNGYWAGTSAAVVCQPHLGASLRKGWYRMIGTLAGAVAIVALTACFPQDRVAFLVGLALLGAACAFVATVLRNFAGYGAALAAVTAVVIASEQLGATGGPNGQAFMLAVTRASEICIGIACAGIVLGATDLGRARTRLARRLAALSVEITARFTDTLAVAAPEVPERQLARRELVRQVVALDPVIDEAIGESSDIRAHSPALQGAVDGLFAALAGWRTVAARLGRLPGARARQEADAVLRNVSDELRSGTDGQPMRWMADPLHVRSMCDTAIRAMHALPASTPSLRLLADQTARVLAGISSALDGLNLLVVGPGRTPDRHRRLRVADWLSPSVNAGRAFVTIGVLEVFWIVTAWPNGAVAIVWAAIAVIVFSPRADRAYVAATGFAVGTAAAALFAAIVKFALLPGIETFAGFSTIMGLYLIPAGALAAQPWQSTTFVPMATYFVPLLAPANEITYDPAQFYNTALALVAGSAAGALSFRLLPPPSPALRTRRLLASTLRDLRRLATGPLPETPDRWESLVYSRLLVLPDEAGPLQRAQLVAALSMGIEIVHLRHAAPGLDVGADVDAVLEAFAQGESAIATAGLDRLDRRLASRPGAGSGASVALRTRGSILAIAEALAQHTAYFGGAPA
jgi:uncharacterized membrane protein YccC